MKHEYFQRIFINFISVNNLESKKSFVYSYGSAPKLLLHCWGIWSQESPIGLWKYFRENTGKRELAEKYMSPNYCRCSDVFNSWKDFGKGFNESKFFNSLWDQPSQKLPLAYFRLLNDFLSDLFRTPATAWSLDGLVGPSREIIRSFSDITFRLLSVLFGALKLLESKWRILRVFWRILGVFWTIFGAFQIFLSAKLKTFWSRTEELSEPLGESL